MQTEFHFCLFICLLRFLCLLVILFGSLCLFVGVSLMISFSLFVVCVLFVYLFYYVIVLYPFIVFICYCFLINSTASQVFDITLWWPQVEKHCEMSTLQPFHGWPLWSCRNRLAEADMMRSFLQSGVLLCNLRSPPDAVAILYQNTHTIDLLGSVIRANKIWVSAKQDWSRCVFCNNFSHEIDVTQWWGSSMVKQFTRSICFGIPPLCFSQVLTFQVFRPAIDNVCHALNLPQYEWVPHTFLTWNCYKTLRWLGRLLV